MFGTEAPRRRAPRLLCRAGLCCPATTLRAARSGSRCPAATLRAAPWQVLRAIWSLSGQAFSASLFANFDVALSVGSSAALALALTPSVGPPSFGVQPACVDAFPTLSAIGAIVVTTLLCYAPRLQAARAAQKPRDGARALCGSPCARRPIRTRATVFVARGPWALAALAFRGSSLIRTPIRTSVAASVRTSVDASVHVSVATGARFFMDRHRGTSRLDHRRALGLPDLRNLHAGTAPTWS